MGAKTLLALAGFAAGYVVGTRRGRKGYDDLKRQAANFVNDPRVQRGLSDAETFVADKVPVVGDTVASAIGAVRQAARKSSSESGSRAQTTGGSSASGGTSSSSGGGTSSSSGGGTSSSSGGGTSSSSGGATPSPTSVG
jgi:hypothetical protein